MYNMNFVSHFYCFCRESNSTNTKQQDTKYSNIAQSINDQEENKGTTNQAHDSKSNHIEETIDNRSVNGKQAAETVSTPNKELQDYHREKVSQNLSNPDYKIYQGQNQEELGHFTDSTQKESSNNYQYHRVPYSLKCQDFESKSYEEYKSKEASITKSTISSDSVERDTKKSMACSRNSGNFSIVPNRINEDCVDRSSYYNRNKINQNIDHSGKITGYPGNQSPHFTDSACGTGVPHLLNSATSQNGDYNNSESTQRNSSHEVEAGTKVFTLLQSACKGDLNTLKRLFHDGTDMSTADYDGRRALHLASAEGHLDCVRFLIETCNVPHSPRDRWYHTPLDEAKSFKKEEVAQYLEEYIQKTEEQEKGAKTFMLLNSACRGDVKTLKRLYQDGVDMRITDYDGRTALHLAAAEGYLDCVKFLVEQAEVPPGPKDRWFQTPVEEARTAKHLDVAEYLDEHIRKVHEKDAGAAVFSILNSACKGDVNSLTKMAHDGVDMQTADYDGRTALHLAASEGHAEVVKFLVEKCKVNPSPVDRWQHTPMDEAKNCKNETIIKYLERYIDNSSKVNKIK